MRSARSVLSPALVLAALGAGCAPPAEPSDTAAADAIAHRGRDRGRPHAITFDQYSLMIDGRRIARSAGGAVLAALGLTAVSGGLWFALHWFAALGFLPLFVSVVVAVFTGGLTYLRISKVLRLEELASVRRLWSRKRRRGGGGRGTAAPPPAPAD